MEEEIKCDNPEPDFMYSKDNNKDIHFWCVNCGREVISIKEKDEKEFKWVHVIEDLIIS